MTTMKEDLELSKFKMATGDIDFVSPHPRAEIQTKNQKGGKAGEVSNN